MAISSHTKWLRFLNLLFSIVVLVLAGNSYTRICTPPNHVNGILSVDIIDNWKRLSIINIATVNGSDSCDFGYEEVTMSTQWPGTNAGCYCKSSSTLTVGSCSSSKLSAGCQTVPATVPFAMNVWRGRKLCVLRAGTAVYWAPDPNADGCPSKTDMHGNSIDFVKCGVGDIAVCQEASLGCPVNRIKLQLANQPQPSDFSFKAYFGDDFVLYYDKGNSTTSQAPIIDFGISEGTICLQNPGDETSAGKVPYPLLKTVPPGCDYYDTRFEKIDQIDEVTFYNDNDLQNITSLPMLQLNSNNQYYFSWRESILWKTVCQDHYYSMKTLHNNNDPFKYVLALHIVVLVFETVFCAYLVVADPLLLYFCYRKAEEEINEYDQPLYAILIIEKFLKLILVPIVLITCVVVGYYRNWYSNLEARCCSDPVTNACFGFVDYILDDLYSLDWANFSVIVVVLIVDMISGLCLFVSRTKENFS
jgi:hypothetical protein